VFAAAQGKTIQGKAYFRGQIAAQNVTVRALDPAGEEIGRTTTDAEGQFRLTARFRCDHRLLVETEDGHGAEFTVAADQLPDDLPPRGSAANVSPSAGASPSGGVAPVASSAGGGGERSADSRQLEAIRAELARLEEQLQAYQDRLRWQDMLGAIGYIVGVTGIAYYYLGVRRKQAMAAGSARSTQGRVNE
jgi:nickel transport protein